MRLGSVSIHQSVHASREVLSLHEHRIARIREAERLQLGVPARLELEIEDVRSARAECVRVHFAGGMKPDLRRTTRDGSRPEHLDVLALDDERQIDRPVLVHRQHLARGVDTLVDRDAAKPHER